MIFEDRISDKINRKVIKIISQTPTEIVADITRADGATGGTPIKAKTFNDFQSEINTAKASANNAVNIASTANGTSESANLKSDNAVSIAATANTKSETAIVDANYAKNKVDEVYAALSDRGASIYVNSVAQASVSFESDPQQQLNSLKTGKLDINGTAANAVNSTYCSSSVNLTGNQLIAGEKTFGKIICSEIDLIV